MRINCKPNILSIAWLLAFWLAAPLHLISQEKDKLIDSLLRSQPEQFGKIMKNVSKYEVQIIYTQVDRDKKNNPTLTHHTFRLGQNYFYPASLVKLPCSLLALEKINSLKEKGITKDTPMITVSTKECPLSVKRDSSSESNFPSAAHYIKKMLLVSDNFSYNRIYELLGKEYIFNRLQDIGYRNTRIVHSFDRGCPDGKSTNAVMFTNDNGDTLHYQPPQKNDTVYPHPLGTVKKGRAHLDHRDKWVRGPKDYTAMNYLPLDDVHDMVVQIIFPSQTSKSKRFDLTDDDRLFLRRYMSMYPRESDHPKYDMSRYEDSHKKYLMFGTYHNKIDSDTMRIFNIVGQSHGELIDCAYFADYKNGVEFFLSAVIYVNSDGVINDGKYEYATIGFPFLTDLGKLIYSYDRKRPRKYMPVLDELKIH